jgi:Arc/MetJ-type ribon-helix-helix transcriptional regulator
MNVNLRGKALQALENMVAEGYANTKSEAIRLAILNFGRKASSADELVERKLDKIDREISAGRRKLLNADEAMGRYAKHVR